MRLKSWLSRRSSSRKLGVSLSAGVHSTKGTLFDTRVEKAFGATRLPDHAGTAENDDSVVETNDATTGDQKLLPSCQVATTIRAFAWAGRMRRIESHRRLTC